jgi:hypothetical protein
MVERYTLRPVDTYKGVRGAQPHRIFQGQRRPAVIITMVQYILPELEDLVKGKVGWMFSAENISLSFNFVLISAGLELEGSQSCSTMLLNQPDPRLKQNI